MVVLIPEGEGEVHGLKAAVQDGTIGRSLEWRREARGVHEGMGLWR